MNIRRAAKALIRRQDGKYLVLTTSYWKDNPLLSQKPDLPGGIVEEHERIEEGLLREIREEIAVEVDETIPLLIWANTYVESSDSVTFLVYLVELSAPEVTLSWEHESYEWLSKEELLTLDIREPYRRIFEHFNAVGQL